MSARFLQIQASCAAHESRACPFCGSRDCDIVEVKPEFAVEGERWRAIRCGGCKALGPPADNSRTAVEMWSERARSPYVHLGSLAP